MPTSSRREDAIIELFVSAYEDCTWKDSHIDWLDRAKDGAVEALVIRPDGKPLAIEHTLIESFVGERDDPALCQADRIVYINVPRDALLKGTQWDAIVTCVRDWLRANLTQLGEGDGHHDCPIEGPGIAKPSTMKLHISIIRSKGYRCGSNP